MGLKPTKTIDVDGAVRWRLDGLKHREDGPAVEYPDGTKYWYLNGLLIMSVRGAK